jgi:DNA invertase Pin-like site-specific DNA recombinase
MGCIEGYARVSTSDQQYDSQVDSLQAAAVEKLFAEKQSATGAARRPELENCLSYVREGDTLCITRLDRLARSMTELTRIVSMLESKGVSLGVLDQGIDTTTSEGRLLFHMLGAFAQFETELRRERQLEGIRKAKQKGIRFGRPKALTAAEAKAMRSMRSEETASIGQIARRFAVSRSTVYRALGG